jgi:hypothetical protein
MSRVRFLLASLMCVAAAPALAVNTPAMLGRSEGIYTPRAGVWEFSLTAPAYPVGGLSVQGVGARINTCNGCGTETSLGLTAGLGYSVTDLVEVGGSFIFVYTNSGAGGGLGGNSFTNLSVEPFLKLNFGSAMARDSRINPFALAGVALGYQNAGGGSGIFSLELAGGAEFMINRWWGITVYIPLGIEIPTASGASAVIGIGLGYGIVTYFD